MLVNKAFKFRLYPTPAQENYLTQQFGAARFVYNYFLRQRIDYYAAHKGEKKPGLTWTDENCLTSPVRADPVFVPHHSVVQAPRGVWPEPYVPTSFYTTLTPAGWSLFPRRVE